jgi:hypothetical protein
LKHPNRKAEAQNRWLCQFHQQIRKSREQSCFNWWLADNYLEPIDMNEDNFLVAISKIRRGGKTIKVELAEL